MKTQFQAVYTLTIGVPQTVRLKGRASTRDECFAWVWNQFQNRGLQGIHEGTILSEQAADRGFETESFTVDAALAPRERDWVGDQGLVVAELYFESESKAQKAKEELEKIAPHSGLLVGGVSRQESQDWNAVWKSHFKAFELDPFWLILPSWDEVSKPRPDQTLLILNPGAGFGTGTHETTQMCLEQLGKLKEQLNGAKVLDFGSGSGILTVAAAKLGAAAIGVEIDPLANDNAHENARLNGLSDKLTILEEWKWADSEFQGVIANILRPVLVEFCERLCREVIALNSEKGGFVILSGLVEEDLAIIVPLFTKELQKKGFSRPAQIFKKDIWRAVVFK